MKTHKINKSKVREKLIRETAHQYSLKKRLFSLIVMLLIWHAISAQVKVSILACPQFNENLSVRIGTDFDIPINSRWSLVPGAYWSLRNRESYKSKQYNESDGVTTNKTYNFHDKAHFLTVPIRMGVRLAGKPDSDFAMKLLFGPYVAYGIDGTSKSNINKNGIKEQTKTGAFDVGGRYRSRWDYGMNSGLNALLKKHFLLGIFVEVGYRKIYNPNDVIDDIMGEIFIINKINLAAGLSFGYQF